MVVWNCNPLVTVPNAELVRRGLARDDLFTVVHEQFLTDTARYADIVLPATTQLETTDVVPAWGHLWMGWNEAAIAPLGESCSNTELFRRLAGAMGFDEPALFVDDATLLDDALGQKVDLAELRRVGLAQGAVPGGRPPVGVRPVPDAVGQGRAGQRDAGADGPARPADVRRATRGTRTATPSSTPATRCSCSRRSTTRGS